MQMGTNLGSDKESNACDRITVSDCSNTMLSLRRSIVDAVEAAAGPLSPPADDAVVARLHGAGDGDRSPRVTARIATFAIEISVP